MRLISGSYQVIGLNNLALPDFTISPALFSRSWLRLKLNVKTIGALNGRDSVGVNVTDRCNEHNVVQYDELDQAGSIGVPRSHINADMCFLLNDSSADIGLGDVSELF